MASYSDGTNPFINFFTHSAQNAAGNMGFKLAKVNFEGEKYVGQEDLAMKLGLGKDTPILALDLNRLREEVMKDNWVKDATIKRILPSEIKISITERKPLAIWKYENQYYVIDDEGNQLTSVDSPDVLTLPLVVGEGANSKVKELFGVLQTEKDMFDQVQAAIRMGNRRWNIVFFNGIEVLMPESDTDEAWHKLASLNKQKNILERAIKSIDMRLPDRVYIRTLNGEVINSSQLGEA
jgi:cell division protein FtsQ